MLSLVFLLLGHHFLVSAVALVSLAVVENLLLVMALAVEADF